MIPALLPAKELSTILEEARLQSWISGHATQRTGSLEELRTQLDRQKTQTSSRTHKKVESTYWGIQVDASKDQCIGVDLEYLSQTFIKRDLQTMQELLELPEESSHQDILVEWTSREAAYKALRQSSDAPLAELAQLKRVDKEPTSFVLGPQNVSCHVKTAIENNWILSIAKLETL
ncbi:MAG: hypothetical protein AB7F59_11420 [Bdellovibrionales bacterium]